MATTITSPQPAETEGRPPLKRDVAFWGMTATQFLGAFNDNLFKQLVLLMCVDYVHAHKLKADIYQSAALALFAIPFVLFSGFGGFLSDRNSKRRIVVLCKVAEIAVMLAGMAAFFIGPTETVQAVDGVLGTKTAMQNSGVTIASTIASPQLLMLLFVVLFFMGTQSAFFGPAKYGILPEMLAEHDLPAANGIVQMTTFLAIIFGTALAGFAKVWYPDRLWVVSGMCVLIAVVGTATSLLLRQTPVADPNMKFDFSSLAINRRTWRLVWTDRTLLAALLVTSLFWLVGGVAQTTVNMFGEKQVGLTAERTSMLVACIGVGIAVGCVAAGKLSKQRVNFRLVTVGVCGMIAALVLLALVGVSDLAVAMIEWTARGLLTLLGFFAGLFAVPLQVFLQARPPKDQKGRMIGAMNLVNWIGILLSSAFYFVCTQWFGVSRISWTFAVLAGLLLPVAVFYRPRDEALE